MEAEARLDKLEKFAIDTNGRLARNETRLEHMATKADIEALRSEMHKGFAETIRWVIGTAVVMAAAAITVITFVLNYATPPRNTPQATPAPVIIQMPPYPSTVPAR